MDITWLAILASLAMGIGTALIFVFAVKRNHFQNYEDAKYHVFWADLEDIVDGNPREGGHEHGANDAKRGTTT
jgi:hypothetical protein